MSLQRWFGNSQGPYFFLTCPQWEKNEMTVAAPVHVKAEHSKESLYLDRVVSPKRRVDTVAKALVTLRPLAEQFDSIVVSGVSGLTMGAILAHELGKNLVIVRKDGEKSHSSYAVEGDPGYHYLIVDDLICSGETLLRVLNVMKRDCGQRPKCFGFFAYNYVDGPKREAAWDREFRSKYGCDRIGN
jgi:adenine/guanine phosphoribosyltransferase-like PRPP-binding protein